MNSNEAQRLTHFDGQGQAHMVDVSPKASTHRVAVATGWITMASATAQRVAEGTAAKGDVLAVARLAGIMATKKTSDLVPLCHPVALSHASVVFEPLRGGSGEVMGYRCTVKAETVGPTGVEMEALTGVQVALLTVYDMLKAVDKRMEMGGIVLQEKSGGRSGTFLRETSDLPMPGQPQ